MAKNYESNKPFSILRLNARILDASKMPRTGPAAATTIPGEPLFLQIGDGTVSGDFLPEESSAIFRSNMVVSNNGGLIMLTQTDQALDFTNISVWDDSPRELWNHSGQAEHFKVRTKDFDLSADISGRAQSSGPSIRKKIYKIYVTFKSKSYVTGVKLNYATNGSNNFSGTFEDTTYYSNAKGFDSYNAGTSSNDWITVGLKPTSSIKNVYSIALQFSYTNAGTVQYVAAQPSSRTVTLTSSSSTDDYYNGMPIFFYKGPGQGQVRTITDYNGSTKVATLNSALSESVSVRTAYDIGYIPSSFQINDISIVYREKSIK